MSIWQIGEFRHHLLKKTYLYLWPNIKRKILAFGHKEKRKINLGKEKTTSVRDAIHSPFWIYSIEMPLLGYFQHFIGESATDHCTLLNSIIERDIKNCCNNCTQVLMQYIHCDRNELVTNAICCWDAFNKSSGKLPLHTAQSKNWKGS